MTVIETVTSPGQDGPGHGVHRLLLVHSPHADQVGQSVFLDSEPATIGRSIEGKGLRVEDPEVSRAHAELRLADGISVLTDMNSRNGTFLNGVRVQGSCEIENGDVLRVGAHILLYQCLDDADCRHLLDPVPPGTNLFGASPKMAKVRHFIRQASPGVVPVLVTGETGVGKELVAQAIHAQSRRTGAFVALNCGALPETLAESELFGHVSGAFTGAQHRQGLFIRARGGTLFLDEIGEMDRTLQKRLLRVLSTGEVRAVGSDQAQRVDARIISATNVALDSAVASGSFRADLYARLAGHVIHVPPLRERREDVLVLLGHFLRLKKLHIAVSAYAAEALLIHDWPFNVRELEQLVGSLEPVLRTKRRLGLEELPENIRARLGDRPRGASSSLNAPLSVLGIRRDVPPNKAELVMLLELYEGNVSQVAAFFGKGRRQVYRWAQQHDIDIGAVRTNQTEKNATKPE